MAVAEMERTSVDQMYERSIKCLPAPERLRLATLILNDISPRAVVDYSDEWTEEDLADFSRSSWALTEEALGEEDDDA